MSVVFGLVVSSACAGQGRWLPFLGDAPEARTDNAAVSQPGKAAAATKGAHPYFPLDKGYEWKYEYVDHAGEGKGNYPFQMMSRGKRSLPELKRSGIVIDEISPQGTQPTAYYFADGYLVKVLGLAYNKEGVLAWTGSENVREFGWSEVDNLQRMLPRRLEPGTDWVDDAQILNARVRTSNHAKKIEAVETPAGRFDLALRIDSTIRIDPMAPTGGAPTEGLPPPPEGEPGSLLPTYNMTEWFVRGIGLVRSVTREGDNLIAEVRLVSASPPKAATKGNH